MKLEKAILIVSLVLFMIYTLSMCNEMNKKSFGIDGDTTNRAVFVYQKYDSIEKVFLNHSTVIHDSIFVATNLPIDTQEIIRRFLTAYHYLDTFRNSDLSIIISDTLFNNQITSRELKYKILRPDSIISNTITITKPVVKPVIFTGIGLGITGNNAVVIPKISYADSKGKLFEAGLLINSKLGVYAGINFKIK